METKEKRSKQLAGDDHYIAALFRSVKNEDEGGRILYKVVDTLSKRFGYKKVEFICDMLIAGCLSTSMVSKDFEEFLSECRNEKFEGEGGPKFCMSVERVRGLLNKV